MKYQTQKIALAYFAVALALFAVQVTMGLVLGWIYVSPNFLSGLIPFNVGRMLHTNSLVVWLLLGFFGAAYYLIPEESEREIHSPMLAWLQLAIFVLGTAGVVVTYLFNLFDGNWLLGNEGREFIEQPKWVKAGIVVAALIFLYNVSMTVLAGKKTAITNILLLGLWVLALLFLLAAKLVSVTTPYVYKLAVDSLSNEAGTDPRALIGLGAVGLVVAYGLARLGSVVFGELRDAVFVRVGQRAIRRLAIETFTHIHQLSLRYHITRKTGGLSRIIERGVKGVDFLLRFMLLSIGPLILELTMVAVIFAWVFGWQYAAVVIVTITLYVWFTFTVTEWRVKLRREMNDQDTDANQKAIDSLLNYETVKYFNAETREADRYDGAMRQYESAAVKTGLSLSFLNIGQAALITAGLVIVMAMSALGVRAGTLTVGDFVMVNAYMIQITMPLNFLGTVYREIRQALVDMGEMFALLGQPAEITDAPDAKPLLVKAGEITFDNVHFAYEPAREILKGVSFTLKPGQKLALVGHSGSGKSTIGRLLFRFYDVTSGAVRIDGQDLRDVTQTSLHAQIGVVPQDTVLFNDTIRYNIAYGRDGASEAEIIAAARAARIHDFVMRLPEGYETKVGERGLKLSGGEKQRVGIARTLLKNPPILILDEATSALDTQTERSIQESLAEMGQGRSVITIAHRLSTIADADQILVLDDGRVIERGTHDDLLDQGGVYAAMWQRQVMEEEEFSAPSDDTAEPERAYAIT